MYKDIDLILLMISIRIFSSFNYISNNKVRAFDEFNVCERNNTRKKEGKVIESEDGRSDLFLPHVLKNKFVGENEMNRLSVW